MFAPQSWSFIKKYFLPCAGVEKRSRGEGQGSDADVTRSGGDADLDVSQPLMESGEIKVEIDMAVDPLYIPKSELQLYSKLFIRQKVFEVYIVTGTIKSSGLVV